MCGQMGYIYIEGEDGLRKTTSEGPAYRELLLKPIGKANSIFFSYDVTQAKSGYKPNWSKQLIFCTRIETVFEKPFW
ncbi:hypothetical protein LEP1GSC203_0354 [Leptospira terpstrae serovar Hualin str. LT 11-33 = ATCC 700639]|uniref:Uncharacterized protein n=1 Tax=Leptospira terpstrae serovar Hualin str. LT 11-33 = ATCC 700639 TaxID=1257025 RepID=N1VQE4_9LEPT|nr:hypothetical protein LEP1GSC203_0354 [Leptospira terpstrae serovar Hualin str. LT 11-33 = ATCC 700639]